MIDILMDNYREEMAEDLSKFIKIHTVKDKPLPYQPYGNGVFNGLMYIHSLADKMDIDCVNLFGHLVYIEYGYGDEVLAILTHADTVPPGEGWTYDPYSGEVVDGKIYGRGAQDNKGPAIAALYAIKALSDNCVDLNKRVRVIFGGDEESGSSDIVYYKQKEPKPDYVFSPDGDYPIVNCEKGLLHLKLYAHNRHQTEGIQIIEFQSGTRINIVPNKAYCKLYADYNAVNTRLNTYNSQIPAQFSISDLGEGVVLIEAFGQNAHGSKPQDGVNAATALVCFLNTLQLSNGTCEHAIKKLAQTIGNSYLGEGLEIDCSDELSGNLTINVGVVDYLNGNFSAQLDIRYPLTKDERFLMERLSSAYSDTFGLHVLSSFAPHHVPESTPIIALLKEAYEEETHDKAYCMAIGGATYARAFDNGVTFGPVFPGKPFTGHGPDEYIEIDDLVKTSQIILNSIMKICG